VERTRDGVALGLSAVTQMGSHMRAVGIEHVCLPVLGAKYDEVFSEVVERRYCGARDFGA